MDSAKRAGAPRTHILDRQIVAVGKGGKPTEASLLRCRLSTSFLGNAFVPHPLLNDFVLIRTSEYYLSCLRTP